MIFEDKQVADMLKAGSYVGAEELVEAGKRASQKRISLLDHLIAEGAVTPDLFGQAVAEHFGVPYADLNTYKPTAKQVQQISEAVAKKYRVILFDVGDKQVVVTTDNPKQAGLSKAIAPLFPKKKVTIAFSLPEDIDDVLSYYTQGLSIRFEKIIKRKQRVAPELVDEIIKDALLNKASDIHFEPMRTEVLIRFRVDGVLHEAGRIPKETYENILNRVKVQSGLRIDKHFAAQDGALRFSAEKRTIDLRVSIVPTINGEKIALRLLAAYVQSLSLSDVGLSKEGQELLTSAAQKPFGMILVTGPTGAGKTTTLYSVLRVLNQPETNITTIEDPVEYRTEGVNQIQVNEEAELTFAKGLRSIVRQDPDIILVGEIRDEETAEIAVNAALTGHLLLSTFHANDAATTIPRLLDMSIEPFLLASTLEIVMAQRLLRRICETCRHGVQVSQKDIEALFSDAKHYFTESKTTLYKGKGCNVCNHTGYRGLIGVFEIIPITSAIEELILRNPSAQEVWALAQKEGAQSLFEDGVSKVLAGDTTIEELLRVVGRPANA